MKSERALGDKDSVRGECYSSVHLGFVVRCVVCVYVCACSSGPIACPSILILYRACCLLRLHVSSPGMKARRLGVTPSLRKVYKIVGHSCYTAICNTLLIWCTAVVETASRTKPRSTVLYCRGQRPLRNWPALRLSTLHRFVLLTGLTRKTGASCSPPGTRRTSARWPCLPATCSASFTLQRESCRARCISAARTWAWECRSTSPPTRCSHGLLLRCGRPRHVGV